MNNAAVARRALKIISRPNFRFFGKPPNVHGGMLSLGDYSRATDQFAKIIIGSQLLITFDWTKWQREAAGYIKDKARLKRASAVTLRKLLTLHFRKERFVTGHLETMITCGHIPAILARLQELPDEDRAPAPRSLRENKYPPKQELKRG